MLNNTCPKCNALPNQPCTLPNGGDTVPHKLRNPQAIDGRMSRILGVVREHTEVHGTVTAHDVCGALGAPSQYTNVSGALRVLAELGHLDKVGKSGGRILYALAV